MDPSYLKLIQSDRVTSRTREALLDRAHLSRPEYVPRSISHESFAVLQAVARRLIPQKETEDFIDIATALDSRKAAGSCDGWRYASMPPDAIALRLGLQLLESTAQLQHGAAFTSLDGARQDALLGQAQKGELPWPGLDARRWFEDLLAEATEIYVSHPTTLAAMGFSGIAFLPEWLAIGLNSAQPWEPVTLRPIER